MKQDSFNHWFDIQEVYTMFSNAGPIPDIPIAPSLQWIQSFKEDRCANTSNSCHYDIYRTNITVLIFMAQ